MAAKPKTTYQKVWGYLNFRGDASNAVGEIMGPNRLGEPLVVLTAHYDAAKNRSRLGLGLATTDNIQSQARKIEAEFDRRDQHPAFFKEVFA